MTDTRIGVKDHVIVAKRIGVALACALFLVDEEVWIGAVVLSQIAGLLLKWFTVFVPAMIEQSFHFSCCRANAFVSWVNHFVYSTFSVGLTCEIRKALTEFHIPV